MTVDRGDEPTEADPVEVAAEAIRLHSNGSAHGSASVAVAALRAAGLVGSRSAAPTREQVEMLGAAGELSVASRKAMLRGSESCRANAVTLFALAEEYKALVALLSRSAAERTALDEAAEKGAGHGQLTDPRGAGDQPAPPGPSIEALGVAAEPKEHGNG